MQEIFKFLTQPYPFNYRGKSLTIFSVVIFVITFYINYFLKPFTIIPQEHKVSFFWISFIHASIAASSILIASLTIRIFKANSERWTTQKDILFLMGCLLLIGIGNFLIRGFIYDNPNNLSWLYFFEEIGNIFIIGSVISILIVSINYNRLLSKYQDNAKKIKLSPENKSIQTESNSIKIITPIKKESFSLSIDDFMFAKADGNYLEIIIQGNDKLEKHLVRISISELLKQLSGYSFIMKSHRSYLVNLHKIHNVEGNAQGYRLTLNNITEQVPVSRSNISKFEQLVQG